ncbi:hypothetical protein MPQ_1452 [Methylovorus sp. MP688]|nr:hypothetical protein MPQ_1452 [Methylovorus sp. MP688]
MANRIFSHGRTQSRHIAGKVRKIDMAVGIDKHGEYSQ